MVDASFYNEVQNRLRTATAELNELRAQIAHGNVARAQSQADLASSLQETVAPLHQDAIAVVATIPSQEGLGPLPRVNFEHPDSQVKIEDQQQTHVKPEHDEPELQIQIEDQERERHVQSENPEPEPQIKVEDQPETKVKKESQPRTLLALHHCSDSS